MQQRPKMKNTKKWGMLLLISLIILINGCIGEKQESPVKLNLLVSPLEDVNGGKLAQVILTVQSETDMQNVSGEITLEEGPELTEGNLQWQTDLQANTPETFNITVKFLDKEAWKITASVNEYSLPAEPAVKLTPSIKIYLTEDEWIKQEEERMKDLKWIEKYYRVCDLECYVPEPLKGQELNDYFKSLDLQEDPVYVMIQFDVPGADPFPEQIETLEDEDVLLLGVGAGGHTQYARVPKKFLEEKHHNFIRWIGIKSPEGKIDKILKETILDKDCTGRIKLNIIFHERLTNERFKTLKQISNGELFGYFSTHEFTPSKYSSIELEVDVDKLKEIASLGWAEKMTIGEAKGCLASLGEHCSEIDPFENIICSEKK